MITLPLRHSLIHARSKDGHLGILAQAVVSRYTPYHLDIRIQAVEELIYLLHLRHHYRCVVTRIDIKQYPLRLADVTAIYQR